MNYIETKVQDLIKKIDEFEKRVEELETKIEAELFQPLVPLSKLINAEPMPPEFGEVVNDNFFELLDNS